MGAISEVYIDHTGGSDSGTGAVDNPWQTLSHAFSQSTSSSTSYRFNVKNTTSGNPMTSLGSLPTGHGLGAVITIQPYETSAGDTEDHVYLDAGGSTLAFNNDTIDNVVFNRCYFQNTGTNSGQFYNLDNFILLYKCVFDNCRPIADNTQGAYYCHFKNMVVTGSGNPIYQTSSTGAMHGCLIEGSGDTSYQYMIQCYAMTNSLVYWDGSYDYIYRGLGAGGQCRNNAFIFSDDTHPYTGGGRGVYQDDQQIVEYNYFENCGMGIDDAPNSETFISGPNSFFNCGTTRFTPSSGQLSVNLPMVPADYTLSSSGYPNAASSDYTMSDELRHLRTNQYATLPGNSTPVEAYFGAFLKNTRTGKQGLHAIESGSV